MNLAEFVARLAARTHPERAAAWDAVGLQVGDPPAPVRTATVVHEVTEAVTERLEAEPVDLVVSYHPLLFRPGVAAGARSQSVRAGRSPAPCRGRRRRHAQRLRRDARRDVRRDGRRPRAGRRAGFAPVAAADQVKVVTFVPPTRWRAIIEALSAAGAGHIGDYERVRLHRRRCRPVHRRAIDDRRRSVTPGGATPKPEVRVEMIAPARRTDAMVEALIAAHPYEEPAFDVYPVASNHALGGRIGTFDGSWDDLVERAVDDAFQPEGLRIGRATERPPRRVAVSPGAGESRIAAAAAAGCDVLVSGDISHHRVVEATDRGLSIIDVGHAASERPGMRRLARRSSPRCSARARNSR